MGLLKGSDRVRKLTRLIRGMLTWRETVSSPFSCAIRMFAREVSEKPV